MASFPNGYALLRYASAVLPDGRLIIKGGEYDQGQAQARFLIQSRTPAPPCQRRSSSPVWTQFDDAVSAVLPNGTFMTS